MEKPSSYPERGVVPDEWTEDYRATYFVDPKVKAGPGWAEAEDFQQAKEVREGKLGDATTSLEQLFPSYEELVLRNERPANPRGPTGITGLGLLGKHGANFACDPIVFRVYQELNKSPKLQMIAIRRRDNGMWAIPGGMADFGESVSATLARELREEALGEGVEAAVSAEWEARFRKLFEAHSFLVYRGTVDDFRNTDTSWMETTVRAFEFTSQMAEELKWDMTLSAGDDAAEATWMVVDLHNLSALNANHGEFVGRAVQLWEQETGRQVRQDGVVLPNSGELDC